ncbi:MAG: phytanoyl-CoA dioxygenase family protein [Pseudomonadota bacterium]
MSFLERYAADGWLTIGGIFEPAFIDALRAEFENQRETLLGQREDVRAYLNVGDERLMLPVQLKGPFLDPRFYANPLLLAMLRNLIGGDILIDNITLVLARSAASEQRLHRDHPELFPEHEAMNAQLPPYAITAVIPLIDLNEESGTTKLFTGTHRGAEPEQAELPYVRRGDCFVMDYRLRHQGTANRSAGDRPILYVVYSRPWFTDITNLRRQARINIDRADIEQIPKEHRTLFRRLAAKGALDRSERELFGKSNQ